MVPDNEIVVTKLENKCNFISNFFVLMHFTGQKKKSIGVIHSVFYTHNKHNAEPMINKYLIHVHLKRFDFE